MAGPADAPRPELVGASEQPVDLRGELARVAVRVDRPSAEAVQRDKGAGVPPTVLLVLEDIRGEQNPTIGYEVFVSTGAEGGTSHHVGTVSFFGIEHTGAERDSDAPHGMRFAFDITDLVGTLQGRGQWDTDALQVSFRPLGLVHAASDVTDGDEEAAAEDRAAAARPVQIGRVGVFYG